MRQGDSSVDQQEIPIPYSPQMESKGHETVEAALPITIWITPKAAGTRPSMDIRAVTSSPVQPPVHLMQRSTAHLAIPTLDHLPKGPTAEELLQELDAEFPNPFIETLISTGAVEDEEASVDRPLQVTETSGAASPTTSSAPGTPGRPRAVSLDTPPPGQST